MPPHPARKSWIVAALAVALAAASSWAWTLSARRREPPAPNVLGPGTTTIVPGIHLLDGLGPSASYAIETSEGLLLVDSGLEPDARRLKSRLAELGLDWRTIRAVFLTHAHGDHCGGAENLRKTAHAKVYAGKGDSEVIRSGGPRDAVFSTFYMPDHDPHPTAVDVPLSGGETLDFGDCTVEALSLPGHTPGSTCYLLRRSGLRVLFTGDVIMQLQGKGVGTYSAYLAPRYRGGAKAYLASLRRLRAMPVPDLVLPGHPHDDPMPQSPRLSADRWADLLDGGIREMEALIARRDRDGADFLDGQPRELLPGLFYLGDLGGRAVYVLTSGEAAILVDAPGDAGLLRFVRERLRALGQKPIDPSVVLLTSVDPGATSGLAELVAACHPRIVAPGAGMATIRGLVGAGAALLPVDEWTRSAPFPVRPIALAGRGVAPVAYDVSWSGRRILISGRFPIRFDHASIASLTADLASSPAAAEAYLDSLKRLSDPPPDLWLPAIPSDGQDANLREDSWKSLIDENARLAESALARARRAAPARPAGEPALR